METQTIKRQRANSTKLENARKAMGKAQERTWRAAANRSDKSNAWRIATNINLRLNTAESQAALDAARKECAFAIREHEAAEKAFSRAVRKYIEIRNEESPED